MLQHVGHQADLLALPGDRALREPDEERVAALLAAAPGAYCPDRYANPDDVAACRPLRAQFASFDPAARLLRVNQFGINLGFSMLMPTSPTIFPPVCGMPTWTVGLVLGVRNLSRQGMFLIGGTLVDRYGRNPMIPGGCALRTVAFVLLGAAQSPPVLPYAGAGPMGVAVGATALVLRAVLLAWGGAAPSPAPKPKRRRRPERPLDGRRDPFAQRCSAVAGAASSTGRSRVPVRRCSTW
ncbi:hypothetical protein [Streptomyces sp. TLI_105]|uniref:hypothetical protein n=1 Tax=Streptomyces sp. TLI_105 TaxID=1881019 RepID=UPI00089AF872|nr:hypothetical protein SAMN05428939_1328 [Streptomyces sp. TLI_105]